MTPAATQFGLDDVLAIDYGRLRGRLRGLQRERVAVDDPRWAALAAAVDASRRKRAARDALVPPAVVDDSLPIAAEATRIVGLIRAHQVLIVAGETGSGKTTQLPKLCLAAGRGRGGMIGCTQPRRIAARSVARRVAAELATQVGALVGFQVRFTDQVGDDTLIKFMTDGILLAETQGDAWLNAYDTLIIDEAHERSLNIDFLVGYLKGLLQRRRDLRVIVTSATIDTERFARHFGGAPVVNVEGRSFPVEVRWRPSEKWGQRTLSPEAPAVTTGPPARKHADPISLAVDEITAEDPHGDILVFLPGEREIRDAHLMLARRRYRATEVLPLYARLGTRDQDRVFNPGVGRRIVLATNVAETSLTVPRIRYVIDPGLARVNRFSHRHKVQRLHIEPISQASADQRKGRCGRVGPGVCYRLYGEDDFAVRPRYTEPELLRSSLAGVILRLMSLKLGAIENFPFLDPPSERAIADGYQQLTELGALTADGTRRSGRAASQSGAERLRPISPDNSDSIAAEAAPTTQDPRRLTDIGRTLARLPIDVKLGRMLVEAQRLGALRELTVIAAYLSIQDPRERPAEAREAADRAHAEFADPKSDFASVLKLWDAYRAAHEELTQSKLRDWCERRFLSFMRMREWRELHRQLVLLCAELRWSINGDPASYESMHRALLAGLVGQVGRKDQATASKPAAPADAASKRRDRGVHYQGTRGRRFQIFPGSALARATPLWLVSATLLDIQKLYAMMNAKVEPEWIEQQAAHLLKRRHFDPHWSRERGSVLAYEQITLFGLSLVEKRRVNFGALDPAESRRIFIREALLTGNIACRAGFVAECRQVLEQARAEETKLRRHGLIRSEDELAQWFEARIPADVASTAALDSWYRGLPASARRALVWTLGDVLEPGTGAAEQFPDDIDLAGRAFELEYRFDPRDAADGVTLIVPLALLNAVPQARLGWLVPGLLPDKIAELIRALPKAVRKNFVPAPDFARAFCAAERADERPLAVALSAFLARVTGVTVPGSDWNEAALPPHLRFNVRLLDESGAELAQGRDLEALQRQFGARARHEFARAASVSIAREGLTRFDFERLPERISTDAGLAAYPALVDTGTTVAIRVFEQTDDAARAHAAGVLRLLRLELADKLRNARKQLSIPPRLALAYSVVASPDALREDLVDAAFLDLAGERATPIRSRDAFAVLAAEISQTLFAKAMQRLGTVEEILAGYAELLPKLKPPLLGFAKANYDDMRAQLAGLVYPGFARELGEARLAELPRYLKALALRADRLVHDPRKDQTKMLEVLPFVDAYRSHAGAHPVDERRRLERLRWLIEEFRVQLFAQELKTREPVSDKRLRKVLEELA